MKCVTVVRSADVEQQAQLGAHAPWSLVLRAAAALAVSMGLGRFAYTPILPLMHAQAGLSAQAGSALATANYAGYLAGAVVLGLRSTPDWRTAWVSCAALAFILMVLAWPLRPGQAGLPTATQRHGDLPSTHRWFAALLASYSLEGVGYIIAGTFLVAAINENSPAWVGSGGWVLVGLAALPGPALWARLGRRWTRPTLLLTALLIQAAGIALPALAPAPGRPCCPRCCSAARSSASLRWPWLWARTCSIRGRSPC